MNNVRADKDLRGADRQGEQAAKTFIDERSGTREPLTYTVGTQGLLTWPEHLFARGLILTALFSPLGIALMDSLTCTAANPSKALTGIE